MLPINKRVEVERAYLVSSTVNFLKMTKSTHSFGMGVHEGMDMNMQLWGLSSLFMMEF